MEALARPQLRARPGFPHVFPPALGFSVPPAGKLKALSRQAGETGRAAALADPPQQGIKHG